jgi:nucleotide-binding universal stress UspA family protein
MTEDGRVGRRIVVGVDASVGAQAALHWAIRYAMAVGAEVIAVHAFEAPVYFGNPFNEHAPVTLDATLRDGVRRSFEEDWCAPLAEADVRYQAVFADGAAAAVLIDVAERESADLIVTGRRGLTTLGELALGSVSHSVVHGSSRPVVLVPGGEPALAA